MDSTPPDARYARHLALPGFDSSHQARLAGARVVVVGAGGLGAPVIAYLAGAGVGHLTIVDDDRIERTNLQRQVLFANPDQGDLKAVVAARRAWGINPTIAAEPVTTRLTPRTIGATLAGATVVVDCSDNLPTRYLLQRCALPMGIPVVWAAIGQYAGQCTVALPGGPCIECLWGPEATVPPWPTAAEAGVFGPVCGVVGALAAAETIKLLTGLGTPLVGRLALVDLLEPDVTLVPYAHSPRCGIC